MKKTKSSTFPCLRNIVLIAGLACVSFASAQRLNNTTTQLIKPDSSRTHFIVRFKPGTSDSLASNLIQRYGLLINYDKSNRYFTRLELNSQHLNAGLVPEVFIRELTNNPAIDYVEVDPVITPDFTPNDPSYGNQWHLNNTGQTGGVIDADIDAPEAWDKLAGVQQTVVAVCDDGVDIDHPDLNGAIWVNEDEIPGNGIDDDANGYIDDIFGWDTASNDNDPRPVGGQSHGTHVAGITGGVHNNGVGISGVGPTVKIMAMRHYAGQGSWMSDLATAIDYAWENGADVITVSYNVDGWNNTLLSAIQRAGAADVAYLNSAGNNNQQNPRRQLMRQQTDNLIFVASTDHRDNRSSFSNYGNLIEIGAPGSSILSTLPGNRYGNQSGTSMATPLAAGVLAVVRGKFPLMTAREALDHMIATADEVPALQSTIPGGKRVNLSNALGAPLGPTSIDSMNIIMGTLEQGTLASLVDSDDTRVHISSESVDLRGEYAVAEFVISSPRTNEDINSMQLVVESASDIRGTVQFVTAFNNVTGRWDTLSSTRLGEADGELVVNVSKTTLSQYVNPTTQKVNVRLQALLQTRRRGAKAEPFNYTVDMLSAEIN